MTATCDVCGATVPSSHERFCPGNAFPHRSDFVPPVTAVHYDHPVRLAEAQTGLGLIAVVCYRSTLTLRIWAADNWRDAAHPAPTFVPCGDAGSMNSTDRALAEGYFDAHLPAIIQREREAMAQW